MVFLPPGLMVSKGILSAANWILGPLIFKKPIPGTELCTG